MSFNDSGHRPHATHFGETPQNPILEGPEGIEVTLDTWGPQYNLFPTMYDALVSNWGDAPSRKANEYPLIQDITGWENLTSEQQAYVEKCFAGQTLQQILEMITFSFTISGISRTCTHQIVRTRHAAFMQHGGRDNDWRHRPWRMPETIRRACRAVRVDDNGELRFWPGRVDGTLEHCLTAPNKISEMIEEWDNPDADQLDLRDAIHWHLSMGRQLYAALVDAGIPWQDARFLLPDGMTTYIHAVYNYVSLRDTLANRLEHIMQWEINCVAQLMLREIKMKCPPLLSAYLGSRSDRTGKAEFAGLESWPPDGKHPFSNVCECGHKAFSHENPISDAWRCRGDLVECDCTMWRPTDTIPRTHRPEQNPFWVLHPDSMAGGPIRWIPTNGTYPKEF